MMKYRVHTDVLLQHNFMLNELAISNEFVQFYSMKMYDLYVKHKGPWLNLSLREAWAHQKILTNETSSQPI